MLLSAQFALQPALADPACPGASEDIARAAEYLVERDNAGDLEGVLAGYTDDIVWLPPEGEAFTGKAAIETRYRLLFSSYQPRLQSEIREAASNGDLGYIVGITQGSLEPLDGGKGTSVDDKFLAIVRCEAGAWRVSHLSWGPRSKPTEKLEED